MGRQTIMPSSKITDQSPDKNYRQKDEKMIGYASGVNCYGELSSGAAGRVTIRA